MPEHQELFRWPSTPSNAPAGPPAESPQLASPSPGPPQAVPSGGARLSWQALAQQVAVYAALGREQDCIPRPAYAGDWRRFTEWCRAGGRCPLPAEPATVAAYLVDQAQRKKAATLYRHVAAIRKEHRIAESPDPTSHPTITSLLASLKTHLALTTQGKPKQVRCFTLAHFTRVVRAISSDQPSAVRDRALLLLGFAGAFRRDELTQLQMEDLSFGDDGLVVTLRTSTATPPGPAHEKYLVYAADPRTCPVQAAQAWLAVLRANGYSTGPLFRSLFKGQRLGSRALCGASINQLVQHYVGPGYTTHSLRASFVAITKQNGADDSRIMNQTKHKTTAMMQRYTPQDERPVDVRRHNAVHLLGL